MAARPPPPPRGARGPLPASAPRGRPRQAAVVAKTPGAGVEAVEEPAVKAAAEAEPIAAPAEKPTPEAPPVVAVAAAAAVGEVSSAPVVAAVDDVVEEPVLAGAPAPVGVEASSSEEANGTPNSSVEPVSPRVQPPPPPGKPAKSLAAAVESKSNSAEVQHQPPELVPELQPEVQPQVRQEVELPPIQPPEPSSAEPTTSEAKHEPLSAQEAIEKLRTHSDQEVKDAVEIIAKLLEDRGQRILQLQVDNRILQQDCTAADAHAYRIKEQHRAVCQENQQLQVDLSVATKQFAAAQAVLTAAGLTIDPDAAGMPAAQRPDSVLSLSRRVRDLQAELAEALRTNRLLDEQNQSAQAQFDRAVLSLEAEKATTEVLLQQLENEKQQLEFQLAESLKAQAALKEAVEALATKSQEAIAIKRSVMSWAVETVALAASGRQNGTATSPAVVEPVLVSPAAPLSAEQPNADNEQQRPRRQHHHHHHHHHHQARPATHATPPSVAEAAAKKPKSSEKGAGVKSVKSPPVTVPPPHRSPEIWRAGFRGRQSPIVAQLGSPVIPANASPEEPQRPASNIPPSPLPMADAATSGGPMSPSSTQTSALAEWLKQNRRSVV